MLRKRWMLHPLPAVSVERSLGPEHVVNCLDEPRQSDSARPRPLWHEGAGGVRGYELGR